MIRNILKQLKLPASLGGGDLLSTGWVKHIQDQPSPQLIIEFPEAMMRHGPALHAHVTQALKEAGAEAQILISSHKSKAETVSDKSSPKARISGVKATIAVASGKGGVGKSTTAVNLAVACAQQGYKVGLVDLDVYGPSIPTMMAITAKPDVTADKKLVPVLAHGVACLSIGMMVPLQSPVIWRGLMVQSAVKQLLQDVAWDGTSLGPLDLLVLDLPPGTGDAQLTLSQQIQVTAGIIVSTPQDVALIDAHKALKMFERVGIPVLGIIETMSQFTCLHCGHRNDIFGHGGAADHAHTYQVPFLGAVPLDIAVRVQSDAGTPVMLAAPTSPGAQAYHEISSNILEKLREQLCAELQAS
jgi:ATP-binding protein involved in chromosome partitioning